MSTQARPGQNGAQNADQGSRQQGVPSADRLADDVTRFLALDKCLPRRRFLQVRPACSAFTCARYDPTSLKQCYVPTVDSCSAGVKQVLQHDGSRIAAIPGALLCLACICSGHSYDCLCKGPSLFSTMSAVRVHTL